jgi:hypothetical protein
MPREYFNGSMPTFPCARQGPSEMLYIDKSPRSERVSSGILEGRSVVVTGTGAEAAAYGPQAFAGSRHHVGRVAGADEQAAAIVFLASDAASHIDGVVRPGDNGWAAVC